MITEFAKVFYIKEEDILGRSREREIIEVRQMYFLRLHESGFNTSKIGRLSGFDRATVINAIAAVKDRLSIGDKSTKQMYLEASKIEYPGQKKINA